MPTKWLFLSWHLALLFVFPVQPVWSRPKCYAELLALISEFKPSKSITLTLTDWKSLFKRRNRDEIYSKIQAFYARVLTSAQADLLARKIILVELDKVPLHLLEQNLDLGGQRPIAIENITWMRNQLLQFRATWKAVDQSRHNYVLRESEEFFSLARQLEEAPSIVYSDYLYFVDRYVYLAADKEETRYYQLKDHAGESRSRVARPYFVFWPTFRGITQETVGRKSLVGWIFGRILSPEQRFPYDGRSGELNSPLSYISHDVDHQSQVFQSLVYNRSEWNRLAGHGSQQSYEFSIQEHMQSIEYGVMFFEEFQRYVDSLHLEEFQKKRLSSLVFLKSYESEDFFYSDPARLLFQDDQLSRKPRLADVEIEFRRLWNRLCNENDIGVVWRSYGYPAEQDFLDDLRIYSEFVKSLRVNLAP